MNVLLGLQAASVFDGIPPEPLAEELARLERRRYPAGAVLIREGELPPRELYVVASGAAEVNVRDRHGREHAVGHAGPGGLLGEMALFTGQRAGATVRAVSDLDLVVIAEAEFHRLATVFPRLYRNAGAVVAERLDRSNRRVVNSAGGRVTVLLDGGAPALLGYALACSLAWHARGPVLLLAVAENPAAELCALATAVPGAGELLAGRRPVAEGKRGADFAELVVVPPGGPFAPPALLATLTDLCEVYDHVLVQLQVASGDIEGPAGARIVRLLASEGGTGRAISAGGRAGGPAGRTLVGWSEREARSRPGRDGVLRVPKLGPSDEAGLREGILPASTPAGGALGWLARDLAGQKVGLALGAGAIKGYAHIGVLRVLEQHRVPVDYVAGTSIGAAVGALYAAGFSPEEALRRVDDVGSQAFRPTLSTNALLSSNGLRAGLRRVAGNARFEDLPMPLAVVAADIFLRREVVFRRGLVWPAVLASMSIPGIYPPLRMGRYTLVDGGVLNPVPGDAVADMGADTVIAVKLASRPELHGADAEALAAVGRAPSVLQAITRTIELMQSKIGADTAASAGILIEPAFPHDEGWGLRNFSAGRRLIPAGEAAAEAALPQIRAALPWLG